MTGLLSRGQCILFLNQPHSIGGDIQAEIQPGLCNARQLSPEGGQGIGSHSAAPRNNLSYNPGGTFGGKEPGLHHIYLLPQFPSFIPGRRQPRANKYFDVCDDNGRALIRISCHSKQFYSPALLKKKKNGERGSAINLKKSLKANLTSLDGNFFPVVAWVGQNERYSSKVRGQQNSGYSKRRLMAQGIYPELFISST